MIPYINKLEGKNNTIISNNEKKALDKIQHPFMKKLNKLNMGGTHFNIIDIYDKPSANTVKYFPLRSGTRQVYPLSPL